MVRKKQYDIPYHRAYYKKNRLKILGQHLAVRLAALNTYGGVCKTCGENWDVVLDIDHIHGGGTQHRANLNIGGDRFYYWLRRNNYPEGFQVLCRNCNWAKHRGKTRPKPS